MRARSTIAGAHTMSMLPLLDYAILGRVLAERGELREPCEHARSGKSTPAYPDTVLELDTANLEGCEQERDRPPIRLGVERGTRDRVLGRGEVGSVGGGCVKLRSHGVDRKQAERGYLYSANAKCGKTRARATRRLRKAKRNAKEGRAPCRRTSRLATWLSKSGNVCKPEVLDQLWMRKNIPISV